MVTALADGPAAADGAAVGSENDGDGNAQSGQVCQNDAQNEDAVKTLAKRAAEHGMK